MKRLLLPVCLVLAAASPRALQGPQERESPRLRASLALAELLLEEGRGVDAFLREHVDAALVERVGADALAERLRELRGAVAAESLDDLLPDGEHRSCLVFASRATGEATVLLRLSEVAPSRIADVWIEGGEHLDPAVAVEPLPPPITWGTLDARMAAEVEAGFSGAVLIAREGEVLVDRGFGLANREEGIPCGPDTVFAIGSTPIDFTKAGILRLAQEGVLELDQPITDFFEGVPPAKRATTLRHLMTGRSGLRDFHDLPSDRDPDHAWIDRDEAVRRILAQELLFAPGEGQQHSHSAWGLLAAVLEVASGTSYGELTRELLFEPAGMHDTGFFGEPIPAERLAIGYGERSDGTTNAPPFWGETSWLVQGSGGMVSTTRDMWRWLRALRSGAILEPEWLAHYWSPPGTLLAGGDMYGFEIVYTEGPGTVCIVISNSVGAHYRRRFNRVARDLTRLR